MTDYTDINGLYLRNHFPIPDGAWIIKFFDNKEHALDFINGRLCVSNVERMRKYDDGEEYGRGDDLDSVVLINTDGVIVTTKAEDENTDLTLPVSSITMRNTSEGLFIFSTCIVGFGSFVDVETITPTNDEEVIISKTFNDSLRKAITKLCADDGWAVLVTLNELTEKFVVWQSETSKICTTGEAFYRSKCATYDYKESGYSLSEIEALNSFKSTLDGTGIIWKKRIGYSYQSEYRFVLGLPDVSMLPEVPNAPGARFVNLGEMETYALAHRNAWLNMVFVPDGSTDECTVVAEYLAEYRSTAEYQSEADLEREFISLLSGQGYEYIQFHSEAALVNNLRRQLEALNGIVFTEGEWERLRP